MQKPKPKFLNINHERDVLKKVLNKEFVYYSAEVARNFFKKHRENGFHVANSELMPSDENTMFTWVKDYELTDEELQQGYRGNYGKLSIVPFQNGRYTIALEKVPIPLKYHPMKDRPARALPDWGHKMMRKIDKRFPFPTQEDALAHLYKLKEEFPEVAKLIPPNAMLLTVYSKELKPSPIKHYRLEVVPEQDHFVIESQDHIRMPTVKMNPIYYPTFVHYEF